MTAHETLQAGLTALNLKSRDLERARQEATAQMRARLEANKPLLEQFQVKVSRAAEIAATVQDNAPSAIIVIVGSMLIASAIRSASAVYENYEKSGVFFLFAAIAALAFVLSGEVAILILSQARARKGMQDREAKRPRTVWTQEIVRVWRVMRGIEAPRTMDAMPERDYTGFVLALAIAFCVVANLLVGIRPALELSATRNEAGERVLPSMSVFLENLPVYPANVQGAFALDVALALLPPLLSAVGGHWLARWSVELAEDARRPQKLFEAAMTQWQDKFRDPLATAEGMEKFEEVLRDIIAGKERAAAKRAAAQTVQPSAPATMPARSFTPARLQPSQSKMIEFFKANPGYWQAIRDGERGAQARAVEASGLSKTVVSQVVEILAARPDLLG